MKFFIKIIVAAGIFLISFLGLSSHTAFADSAEDEFEIRNGILLKYHGSSMVVDVPKGVRIIGKDAFAESLVYKVILPEGVTKIDTGAFRESLTLIHAVLPESLQEIGDSAFEGCIALYDIQIPDQVVTIGESAFNYCMSLTKVSLPHKLQEIKGSAFLDCSELETVLFPKELKEIGEFAFSGTGITEALLPESLKSIGAYAFSNCSKLKVIAIPEKTDNIETGFLYKCRPDQVILDERNNDYKLSSNNRMLLSKDGTFLHSNFFERTEIINIPSTVTTIGAYAFADYQMIERVQLPENVRIIERNAFSSCRSLKEVIIPKKVNTIEPGAFSCNPRLKSFRIDRENPFIKSSENGSLLLSRDEKILYAAPSAVGIVNYLPSELKEIEEGAFYECQQLTKVILPQGVDTIKKEAFYNCISLTEITLPESLLTIGEKAFDKCLLLSRINFPSKLKELHRYAIDYSSVNLIMFRAAKPPVIIGDPDYSIDDEIQDFDVYVLIKKNTKKSYLSFMNQYTKAKPIFVEEGDFYVEASTFKVNIISHPNYEYSMDGTNYQSSPIFKSLLPDKKYVIYMRNQADKEGKTGKILKKSFRTEAANQYNYDS